MKYLELIKGQFTAEHEARAKQQEPYVAYSEETGGVMYTFIPEPVTGPADNEIWYTTTDGAIIQFEKDSLGDSKVIKNEYKDKIGIITFDKPITVLNFGFLQYYRESHGEYYSYPSLESVILPDSVTSLECGAVGNQWLDDNLALTSITLGLGLQFIASQAFFGCETLTDIIYKGTISQWNNIVKEENWYLKDHINTTVVHCSDGDIAL